MKPRSCQARRAAQSGDEYHELLAEGMRYGAQKDTRRAARALREAIALRPDRPDAYFHLGAALCNSGHDVEAAQRFLEAKDRYSVGSVQWAQATARTFIMLIQEACAEAAKPEWWNDEGLKALSARVMRAAPDELECMEAHQMRAGVLSGLYSAWEGCWEGRHRSAAELREAATHYDHAAVICSAPVARAELTGAAELCRRRAEAM